MAIVVDGVPLTLVNVNVVALGVVATICEPLICVAVDGPVVPMIKIAEFADNPCGNDVVTVTVEPLNVNAVVPVKAIPQFE